MAHAHLGSLDTLKAFRPALLRFAQDSARALGEADTGVQRAIGRLETELPSRWSRELARRQDKLSQAKDAYRAKTMFKDSSGKAPSAVDERVEVDRWTHQVAEAQFKIEACRKWRGTLIQQYEQFRAKVRAASDLSPMMAESAVQELDRAVEALEAYLALQGPDTSLPPLSENQP